MSRVPADRIRRAVPPDLDRIVALETICFRTGDGRFSRRQLRALLRNPNAYWLVTTDGKAMACWLKVSNGRARWARLYSLAVHPQARGHGIAGRLLAAGRAWMRKEKIKTCRAEVNRGNRAALSLYAREGFQPAGVAPDYYAPGVDAIRLVSRSDRRSRADRRPQSQSGIFPGCETTGLPGSSSTVAHWPA